MTWSLAFEPLISLWALLAAAILALLLVLPGLLYRLRGAPLRCVALGALILALANPVVEREERERLANVAAIVVDRSESQSLDGRSEQTETALAALKDRLLALDNIELRVIDAGARRLADSDGTALFSSLTQALGDVPPERLAGTFFITDGQIHDIPADAEAAGLSGPVHGLVTGNNDERDIRVVLESAPRFGIVDESQTVRLRIEDTRAPSGSALRPEMPLTISRDGTVIDTYSIPVGVSVPITIDITHGGLNLFQFQLAPIPGELTEINNTALLQVEGIRENLRVLLISGKPHAGERTWRNLLKSDASVDLVHFTILRPPEKQDGTPINELSLIAFPTRELFSERIDEFDLIIFDRYERLGVLSHVYFYNIAEYVARGGAVMFAAGPGYSSSDSLFDSPLSSILPAEPTGTVLEEPFHARVSDIGNRHPVTRALPGANQEPPDWSRWFRLIDVTPTSFEGSTNTIMTGLGEKPLLMLSRYGEGRLALMLSDHAWLWARGFEGGGPHVQLLRRLGHWLMKEPDLEEERLTATAGDGRLVIERQTLEDLDESSPDLTVSIETPTGDSRTTRLGLLQPGIWQDAVPVEELGLYRVSDGTRETLVQVGPDNPREYRDALSTPQPLTPLSASTGGSVARLLETPDSTVSLPRILPVRSGGALSGNGWMGLRMNDATRLIGIDRLPLFAGLLGLALLLGLLSAMWYREGR
jgi:hypothetical protein